MNGASYFLLECMKIEVLADALSEEWKGYIVLISCENDNQSFSMKQDVLTHRRVILLLSKRILVIDQGEMEKGSTTLWIHDR